jgi:hypothetical protein
MTKHLEIKFEAFDPGAGYEYTASMYPGPGIYYNNRNTTLVYLVNGSAIVYSMCFPSSTLQPFLVDTAIPNAHADSDSIGITARDVKELIAIMTSKEAGIEYIKKCT